MEKIFSHFEVPKDSEKQESKTNLSEKKSENQETEKEGKGITRRDFLKDAALLSLAAMAGSGGRRAEKKKTKKLSKKEEDSRKFSKHKGGSPESKSKELRKEFFAKREIVLSSGEKFRNRANVWNRYVKGDEFFALIIDFLTNWNMLKIVLVNIIFQINIKQIYEILGIRIKS